MSRVTEYLNSHKIRYQLLSHQQSRSTISSAICAHVPIHQLAKAVVLEDHEGRHLMAVLPGDYKLSLTKLGEDLNRSFKLAKEQDVYQLFSDCACGAVPPVPNAYRMDAIFDEELNLESEVYLEAGDHETLIQLFHEDYVRFVASHRQGRFSRRILH